MREGDRHLEAPAPHGAHAQIALYVRIASILKGRIVRGDWPHGALVPGVDQLSILYGVARATARQALQALVAEGLIVSERGRGSRVVYVKPPVEESDNGLFHVVGPTPKGHRITVLERRHGLPLNGSLFGQGTAYDAYTLVRKVHAQHGIPYGYFEVYVAGEVYARLPRHADGREKVAALLVEHGVDIFKGEETLTVDSADWQEATLLECPMAAPIARVVRVLTDRSRRIVYAANNIYRGDRFRQKRVVSGYYYKLDGAERPASERAPAGRRMQAK